jgi:hypothetical protein
VPVSRRSPLDVRLKLARALGVFGWLEYSTDHDDAAETLTRQMLDVIADSTPDAATRRLRASGEASMGNIRLKQGHAAEAVALLKSAAQAFRPASYPKSRSPIGSFWPFTILYACTSTRSGFSPGTTS